MSILPSLCLTVEPPFLALGLLSLVSEEEVLDSAADAAAIGGVEVVGDKSDLFFGTFFVDDFFCKAKRETRICTAGQNYYFPQNKNRLSSTTCGEESHKIVKDWQSLKGLC